MTDHRVLLLDVNETLSDLSPLGERFAALGLPDHLAVTWFTATLREGFALAAAGTTAPFAEIAGEQLRALAGEGAPVDDVLAAFTSLDVHDDVRRGLPLLAEAGHRVVTLSNGSYAVAEGLLERAGLREHVEACLSVEDAGVWKPHPTAYRWAVERLGVVPEDVVLVAVHPWDVAGAVRAGLGGAWVDRGGGHWPSYLPVAPLRVTSFVELAERLDH